MNREVMPKLTRLYWCYCDELSVEYGVTLKDEIVLIPEYASRRATTTKRSTPGHRNMRDRAKSCVYDLEEAALNLSRSPTLQRERSARVADESMTNTRNLFLSLRQQRVLSNSRLLLGIPGQQTCYQSMSHQSHELL